ncbi:MAG: FAD-dependent thymidylate synthase [Clostridia bacterium]|nr:FAD-dependent thymidylate synthase [Clostridia bacterium]MBQ8963639.1 FAD-dependent thymidylate synthase [Clostridia bacterium]
MNIIQPGFAIEERDEERGGLAIIERAARTCYKTEDKIAEGSAERIVRMLIQRHHEAMLEHGDYIFLLEDYKILDNIAYSLRRLMERGADVPLLTFTNINQRPIISGNIRAWRELLASQCLAAQYFTGAIDPIYTSDLITEDERIDDPRVKQIHYSDLQGFKEKRVHLRQTVRFIVDRGVTHEFVRHRVMSFAQESTRYCDYSNGKQGDGITVIEPSFMTEHTEPYDLWKRQCMSADTAYTHEKRLGLKPEEARTVLPQSTKAELVMTGTLRQWDHFFDMRARQTTGPAHPQAAEVSIPLMQEMAARFPDVIRA